MSEIPEFDDVIDWLHYERDPLSPADVIDWCKRYPRYADQLVEYYCTLAIIDDPEAIESLMRLDLDRDDVQGEFEYRRSILRRQFENVQRKHECTNHLRMYGTDTVYDFYRCDVCGKVFEFYTDV